MKTLVIHPKDPTTDFLCEIYKGRDWSVINDPDVSKSFLVKSIIDLRNPSVKSLRTWESGELKKEFVEKAKGTTIIKPTKAKPVEEPVVHIIKKGKNAVIINKK